MANKKEQQVINAAKKFVSEYKAVQEKKAEIKFSEVNEKEYYLKRYSLLNEFNIKQAVVLEAALENLNEEE